MVSPHTSQRERPSLARASLNHPCNTNENPMIHDVIFTVNTARVAIISCSRFVYGLCNGCIPNCFRPITISESQAAALSSVTPSLSEGANPCRRNETFSKWLTETGGRPRKNTGGNDVRENTVVPVLGRAEKTNANNKSALIGREEELG